MKKHILDEWESSYRAIIDAMIKAGNEEGKRIVKKFQREVYLESQKR